jgi:hypothetical protein
MQTNKMGIYPHEPVKKVRVRSFAEFIESGEYSEDSEEESKSNAISKIHKPESNTSSMIDLGFIKQK